MRRASSPAIPPRSPLPLPLAILAVALLLVVPVSARAGGEVAHAHALFQLVADGADGRLDHHQPPDEPPAAPDHGHGHRQAALSVPALPPVRGIPDRGERSSGHAPTEGEGRHLGSADAVPLAADDAPTLSPMTAAAMAALFSAIGVAVPSMPSLSRRATRLFSGAPVWLGRAVAPEPPPPRRSLVAA